MITQGFIHPTNIMTANSTMGSTITFTTNATTAGSYVPYTISYRTPLTSITPLTFEPVFEDREEVDFDRTKELDDFLDNYPII